MGGKSSKAAKVSKRQTHPEGLTFNEITPKSGNAAVKNSYNISSKVLGEGGFSSVKLATHKESGHKVAIKIASDKDVDARLEVELMTHLGKHDHIIGLIQTFRLSSKLHMVMEFCKQGDLMDLLVKVDRFEEVHARRIARQLLLALNHCHESNIAHRDMKGENVLYTGDLEHSNIVCKLADFGAATYFPQKSTVFTEKIGSSCYVAPEVLKEEYFPHKADMWSFGATMFTLVNGEPPFHAVDNQELTFKRVKTQTFELPVTVTRTVSTAGQHFIMTLMSRRSWARPSAKLFLRHPWVKLEKDNFTMVELPDMEVPSPEDPADIPDDEILVNPKLSSDTPKRPRRHSSRHFGYL